MRQVLRVGGSAGRVRSTYAVAVVCLILAVPLLAGCGLSDIFGKKATATVPAALLATPGKTATTGAATTQAPPPAATKPAPTNTVAAEATVAAAQATVAAQPTGAAGSQGTYTVVQGDTLSDIAGKFGLTAEELAAANGLTDPNKLSIGQTLVIPAPGSVTTPPQAAATQQPQQQGAGSPELTQFGQDIQLDQIGGWLSSLGPMVTTMSANPSAICTSSDWDALTMQGQALMGAVNGMTNPPPSMAAMQAQLGSGLQGINDGLASIKKSMCEMNDSVAATTGLLQLSLSLAQVQTTVDAIGQSIQQGISG